MKTAQIMEREFRDGVIRQNHKTTWFNATDLIKIANQYRQQLGQSPKAIADYLKNDSTKEFIEQILDEENVSKVYETKKGKSGGTWVHPLLLIDLAMWLSPKFKYEAIKWLQDELLHNRDISGESYKKLTSAVSIYYGNQVAKTGVAIPKIAHHIKKKLNVTDWNSATEKQLKDRDTIHNNIVILLDAGVDIQKSFELGIKNVIGASNG